MLREFLSNFSDFQYFYQAEKNCLIVRFWDNKKGNENCDRLSAFLIKNRQSFRWAIISRPKCWFYLIWKN